MGLLDLTIIFTEFLSMKCSLTTFHIQTCNNYHIYNEYKHRMFIKSLQESMKHEGNTQGRGLISTNGLKNQWELASRLPWCNSPQNTMINIHPGWSDEKVQTSSIQITTDPHTAGSLTTSPRNTWVKVQLKISTTLNFHTLQKKKRLNTKLVKGLMSTLSVYLQLTNI
jgi:hypothetical protein